MAWLLPLIGLIAFELVADIFAKEYSLRRTLAFAAISLLCYVICNAFWLLSLRNGAGLARGAVLFSVASAILACVIGAGFYEETITTYQWIGIGIGLVAIGLLSV